jgi:hypothetical protein
MVERIDPEFDFRIFSHRYWYHHSENANSNAKKVSRTTNEWLLNDNVTADADVNENLRSYGMHTYEYDTGIPANVNSEHVHRRNESFGKTHL